MTSAIAAAVAIVPSTLAGVGIAIATGKAAESIARQPEAAGQIRSSMLIGCALAVLAVGRTQLMSLLSERE